MRCRPYRAGSGSDQSSGDVINLTSVNGVYSPDRGEIDASGDVVITSRDTGLVMTSQAITASFDEGDDRRSTRAGRE